MQKYIKWFCLYETLRQKKFIDIDSISVVTQGWRWVQSLVLIDHTENFWDDKIFKVELWWWPHKSENL